MAGGAGWLGRHGNVYLYLPNIVGYLRVVFMVASFGVARTMPLYCAGIYFLGFVLDETDGRLARMFNQTSTFGAVLDMVTDRVATCCLLCLLSTVYPSAVLVFQLLLMLDIFSHWFQMYAASLSGVTHKDVESKSRLVRMYYKHRVFMGYCCVSVEVLLLSFYLIHFQQAEKRPWGTVSVPLLPSAAPGFVPEYWKEEGIPLLYILVLLALPGFTIKQATNFSQIQAASSKMVAYDAMKANKAT